MDITNANLDIIFKQANLAWQEAFYGYASKYKQYSMTVPMTTRSTIAAMLDRLPQLREWIGDRVINNAASLARPIVARPFEGPAAPDKTNPHLTEEGAEILLQLKHHIMKPVLK